MAGFHPCESREEIYHFTEDSFEFYSLRFWLYSDIYFKLVFFPFPSWILFPTTASESWKNKFDESLKPPRQTIGKWSYHAWLGLLRNRATNFILLSNAETVSFQVSTFVEFWDHNDVDTCFFNPLAKYTAWLKNRPELLPEWD